MTSNRPALTLVPALPRDSGDGGPDSAAAVEAHLAWLRLRGMAAGTLRQREAHLRRLSAFLAPVALLDAQPDHLLAWRRSIDHRAPATIRVYTSHVHSFYWWATIREHLITRNPAEAIPVPKLPRRLPRPISEEALFHALSMAPYRTRCWLVLAGWAGLRAIEIAGLRGENVHLRADPPVLHIVHDATKGRRERTVPISPFVAAELARAQLPAIGLCFRKADGDPVPANLVSQVCCRHLHALGIEDSLHSLRHRFGSGTYRLSHDLRLVQELLGHQSPVTTAGYAAWSQGEAAGIVDSLPVPESDL